MINEFLTCKEWFRHDKWNLLIAVMTLLASTQNMSTPKTFFAYSPYNPISLAICHLHLRPLLMIQDELFDLIENGKRDASLKTSAL